MLIISSAHEAKKEITTDQYLLLKGLAAKSCSGEKRLKAVVLKGPISNAKFSELTYELEQLAKATESAKARAAILDAKAECI